MPSCSTPSRKNLPHCQDNDTQNFGPPPDFSGSDLIPFFLACGVVFVVWLALRPEKSGEGQSDG